MTHHDPYPYYAELVARRPLHRDDALGLWVAAGAAAVRAVLESEACRVRPPAEPVPAALRGSPAGEIFGRLVRMNDGAGHSPMKHAVSAALASIDANRLAAHARTWAERLADELDPAAHSDRVTDFAFRLPVYVLGSLIGIAPEMLPTTADRMSDFVRCIAPGGTPEQLARGTAAAGHLIETFRALHAARGDALLATLAGEARRVGRGDDDVIVANGIGFLSQAYEATAGLIGNTLVAVARQRELRDRIARDPASVTSVVREVVRWDAPVQNTRRFVGRDGVIAGQPMNEGDAVLVVLAAANRDPAANPHPDRLDPDRADRQAFTFGAGVHACPGETMATTIAAAGVERLIADGVPLDRLAGRVTYRASANTRIPLLTAT